MNQDDLSAQARAIVDRAKALGLIWTLRPATVGSINVAEALVTYDADSEFNGAFSLISGVRAGDRVMMLQVPPAGNFIIGRLGLGAVNASLRAQQRSTGDVTLTTTPQAVTPSVSVSIASESSDYLVIASFDLDHTVSGGANLGIGILQVDGVAVSGTVQFGVSAAAQRASVCSTWYGTLEQGSHTFQLFANKTVNVGTFICRATHTNFSYQVWQ